jgi:hypothetical protein
MQQASGNDGRLQVHFGQDQGHIQGVLHIGLAGGAFLAGMGLVGHGVGLFNQRAVAGRQARRQRLKQSL